jgi:plastocyanin
LRARFSNRAIGLAAIAIAAIAGAAWAGTHIVDQKDLKFSVGQLKIARGDYVEFDNSDDTSHNITIRGQGFTANSGLQAPGKPFKTTLAKPGVYLVTCGIHPRMKMTVIVE